MFLFSAAGKLVALHGSGSSVSLQVLNDDYTPNGQTVALPNATYLDYRLTPLANGKLLRIGGVVNNGYTSTSGVVQSFDPATRSIATLATKPTAVSWTYFAVEAGNGEVFGFNGAQVDRFSGNVWTENVATVPSTVLAAERLPSGKLLLVCATAQYVFNPAAPTQLVAVAAPLPVSSPRTAATAAGVRVFDTMATVSGLSQTLAVYDYSEAAGTFISLKPYVRTPNAWAGTYYRGHTVALKDGGVMLVSSAGTAGMDGLIHRVSYTPRGTVKAVKL